MDKRKNNGGHSTKGVAGRKPKADEEKANYIFLQAINKLYDLDNDDEAKTAFAFDLLSFERGKMFVAEHLFGKPKETVHNQHELIDFDIKNYLKFGNSK
jgi:hypothetical protein